MSFPDFRFQISESLPGDKSEALSGRFQISDFNPTYGYNENHVRFQITDFRLPATRGFQHGFLKVSLNKKFEMCERFKISDFTPGRLDVTF